MINIGQEGFCSPNIELKYYDWQIGKGMEDCYDEEGYPCIIGNKGDVKIAQRIPLPKEKKERVLIVEMHGHSKENPNRRVIGYEEFNNNYKHIRLS